MIIIPIHKLTKKQRINIEVFALEMSKQQIIPDIESRIIRTILYHPDIRITELASMLNISYGKLKGFLDIYFTERLKPNQGEDVKVVDYIPIKPKYDPKKDTSLFPDGHPDAGTDANIPELPRFRLVKGGTRRSISEKYLHDTQYLVYKAIDPDEFTPVVRENVFIERLRVANYVPSGNPFDIHMRREKFFMYHDEDKSRMIEREYKLTLSSGLQSAGLLSPELLSREQIQDIINTNFIDNDEIDIEKFYYEVKDKYRVLPAFSLSTGRQFVLLKMRGICKEFYPDGNYYMRIAPSFDLSVSTEENQEQGVRYHLRESILNLPRWEKECFDEAMEHFRREVYTVWRNFVLSFYGNANELPEDTTRWNKIHKEWIEQYLPEEWDPMIDYFGREYKAFWHKVMNTVEGNDIPWRSLMPIYLLGDNPYCPSHEGLLALLDPRGQVDPRISKLLDPEFYDNYKKRLESCLKI